jgi:hypothetical protein
MIERSPLAPVLRSIAFLEIAPSASSGRVRSTLSISNSRWYCLTSAFLGSVRMRLSARRDPRAWRPPGAGPRTRGSARAADRVPEMRARGPVPAC